MDLENCEEKDDHLTRDRDEGELLRHLDVGHGIDPNTIELESDLIGIHEREHDAEED